MKIDIRSFLTISRCSSVFFKTSEPLIFSSFSKDCLALSKLSIKFKDSDVLKKTLDHLEIVKKDLISIFKKNNIEEIVAIGQKLDPNYHQAMMEIEDNNKEPGTIIQEIQKGYKMKDRLLRPSLVGVSKKTEKSKEKSPENPKK